MGGHGPSVKASTWKPGTGLLRHGVLGPGEWAPPFPVVPLLEPWLSLRRHPGGATHLVVGTAISSSAACRSASPARRKCIEASVASPL